ncbi:FKBP-type peptidyl-prolyl cis-trans isomerase [Testudinibacter sp. TR-2022]|uniref:FKBP-type peptidyl-prolyl cis-trans isomerase n=1 Tax=Testudinibacter sp. TR-2022 TaxID=2585029 RepID=UPI00111A5936|nr:FKBP-type peptidyl-prolyl cis-trans isomerase [Testudinibacter sp. TR-2022]TNH05097.1 FKBP-type peptidyl-prolyl cis-trans isomerase [Pasteurellaceae bacterium Phil31]TNH08959.1 FKBP-type peptidyl-prolyl cis-trans isomerase [Testudinibacter sp. TR-2022]TNH10636.1 FKBP-type peptidyl-prolyl cis-trans isomerase [Testudinibacter sp. TR-2022]TNH17178.1 FKBP-type peptidyl-prolyl cis-trans isomerase [Testudinibacter sp. TR-2022]TNH20740.1 FKBP-type peptidyl-prolyl cis-trans isomerase [Testudinibact
MSIKKKLSIVALLVASAVSASALAAEGDNLKNPKFVEDSSYALGVLMGKNIQQVVETQKDFIVYDQAKIIEGLNQTLDGKSKLDDKQLEQQLRQLDQELAAVVAKQEAQDAKDNADKGAEFRKEYAKKDGVKSTKSGLLYRVEAGGAAGDSKVEPTDTVKVHYQGKLINGEEFDSSYKRGEPIEFQLNQLIPGWIEGIPLINKGGKIELVIPPELGYGEHATGNIPPNSTLIFNIELLDVKKANAAGKK